MPQDIVGSSRLLCYKGTVCVVSWQVRSGVRRHSKHVCIGRSSQPDLWTLHLHAQPRMSLA